MRVRINGGAEGETARIAQALTADGFVISAGGDPCDLVLTVGDELPARISLGDHVVDFTRRRVQCQGQAIWLTPAEFGLLGYLHQARRPVSRGELLRELWGLRFDPQTNSVAVHVSRLRRKLGRTAIVTEPEGYRIGVWSGMSEERPR